MLGASWSRPSTRNDAGLVNHLVGDRHEARALHDAGVRVVDRREHRAGYAAGDAAVVEGEVSGTVERTVAEAAANLALLPGSSLGGNRRHSAIGWIDHQRCSARRIAALEPMRRRRRGRADGAGVAAVGCFEIELGVVTIPLRSKPVGGFRELLVAQFLARAEFRGRSKGTPARPDWSSRPADRDRPTACAELPTSRRASAAAMRDSEED